MALKGLGVLSHKACNLGNTRNNSGRLSAVLFNTKPSTTQIGVIEGYTINKTIKLNKSKLLYLFIQQ
jgi:hypothetical protein